MVKIFISYSSKDKDIANKIALFLQSKHYFVWMDEWRILIGQNIPSEIEKGLEGADFLILILSKYSVNSKWVDLEWKTKYWDEINRNEILILPVCIDDCEIPSLLKTKKYLKFNNPYSDSDLETLIHSIYNYSEEKYRRKFFHSIDTVWEEINTISNDDLLYRNLHWDLFSSSVNSLTEKERVEIQKENSLYYLDHYKLSVSQLKEQLNNIGFYHGKIDDEFTLDLIKSIIAFQEKYNLRHIDGVFGPLTYLEIKKVIENLNINK